MPSLTQEAKAALGRLGVSPRKKFGQHFMIDEKALAFIADALSPEKGETVLEIGPGLGFLTRELLSRQAQVIAVEKDDKMASSTDSRFHGNDKIKIIKKDILRVDPEKDLGVAGRIKVVGNIPYNITSPLLEWLIQNRARISEAVLTVQSEVAGRLASAPGGKNWGALSIFVQVYAEAEILKEINRAAFYPAPRVDSAVVRLVFSAAPRFPVRDEAKFFRIVRRAFQKRRKTLVNALEDAALAGFSKPSLKAALEKIGIHPSRRPETLGIPDWNRLSEML
ncbi:MAG: ribosomal RNA small subunit methyltransferase A [Candidatus Omnitrophica bacterium]|nr:ribosomal RNA small subunit methyltransferase A [Candidatus Omnitrophota bacterium]